MPTPISRRRFLGQASCAGISALPILNTLMNLRMFTSVANAVTLPTSEEYRALVCIFFSGGNDSFNMLTPYGVTGPGGSNDTTYYTPYFNARSDLALSKSSLIELTPPDIPAGSVPPGSRTYGLHGAMPNLAGLFHQQKAAFITNVGTLVEPVPDKSLLNARRLPVGLYSHSDQIEQWQTSVPNTRAGVGWAGRMMDVIKDVNGSANIPFNISVDGSNVWQTGVSGAEYAVARGDTQGDLGGAVALEGYTDGLASNTYYELSNVVSAATDSMLQRQYANLLQQTYQRKRKDAQDTFKIYDDAVSGLTPTQDWNTGATQISLQLRQVALALRGGAAMGAKRQTFFVNLGGWDHHSDTLFLQNLMLGQVDAALGKFWAELGEELQEKVVIFSASDFGRTLSSNQQGSDHAWGGNQFVLGGKVKGGRVYGSYPDMGPTAGNPLDTGRGRFIPTTSCDEFFAEMALWLGVPASDMPLVLPNIGNFTTNAQPTLNFLM
jgi:uncharacterized protein (DUF1501 family)